MGHRRVAMATARPVWSLNDILASRPRQLVAASEHPHMPRTEWSPVGNEPHVGGRIPVHANYASFLDHDGGPACRGTHEVLL